MSDTSNIDNERPIRPVFKVIAIMLAIITIPFGLLFTLGGIQDMINVRPFSINKTFLQGILSLMWACFFIKQAFKKTKEKKRNKPYCTGKLQIDL